MLYECEMRGTDPQVTLSQRVAQADPPVPGYTVELVEGVGREREPIDRLLRAASDWPLERMPAIDRCLLRLGAYELLYNADVPDGVAIAETVALASQLSTEDSGPFVNGVLARLAADKTAVDKTAAADGADGVSRST